MPLSILFWLLVILAVLAWLIGFVYPWGVFGWPPLVFVLVMLLGLRVFGRPIT
jgi:hypothetical protein